MIIAIDTNAILPGQVGGIESYTLGLIEALLLPASPATRLLLITRPENHDLFSRYAGGITDVCLLDRPRVAWSDLGKDAQADFADRKRRLLRHHRAQVVHFPGNTINPLDLDLPIVLNLHDLQHRHFPPIFHSRRNLQPRALVDRLRPPRRFPHRRQPIRPRRSDNSTLDTKRKIFVTPDPFQAAFFTPPPQADLNDLCQRFSLPETFFIYPAAAWPHKNHPRLISAFLAADLPGAQLILTGGGQSDSPLPKIIADLNAQNTVRLLGRVSTADLISLYQLATAMIFPSQHESWSIPIMEAMACGCPVASSNVTSLPEELADAGLLFDPDDTLAITASIRRLTTDPALRQRLSDAGKQRVLQFSPNAFLKVLASAYTHALARHAAQRAA